MTDALRHVRIDGLLAPTHDLRRAVTAFRIVDTDELGTQRRLTVMADGGVAVVTVPPDFRLTDTPVAGDYVVVAQDGEAWHMRADVFERQALPVPRANAGATELPRVPRFPG